MVWMANKWRERRPLAAQELSVGELGLEQYWMGWKTNVAWWMAFVCRETNGAGTQRAEGTMGGKVCIKTLSLLICSVEKINDMGWTKQPSNSFLSSTRRFSSVFSTNFLCFFNWFTSHNSTPQIATMISPSLWTSASVANHAESSPGTIKVAFQRFHCKALLALPHTLGSIEMLVVAIRVHCYR